MFIHDLILFRVTFGRNHIIDDFNQTNTDDEVLIDDNVPKQLTKEYNYVSPREYGKALDKYIEKSKDQKPSKIISHHADSK